MNRISIGLGALALILSTATGAAGVPLGSGVILDTGRSTAWVAAPEGRIAAVNLDDGSLRWNGPALGHPLAVVEGQLLVALRPDEPGIWLFALVNPETGAVGERFAVSMPAGVVASLEPMPSQQFEVFAQVVDGQVQLHWFSQRWPFRGAKLEDDEGVTTAEGVVQVDIGMAQATRAEALTPVRPRIDLDASERIAGLAEVQLRSADDRHAMQRTPVADAVLGQRWEWQIHSRSSGSEVTRLVLPEAAAPWLLDGERLFWVSRPQLMVGADGKLSEQPASLFAVGLGESETLWSVSLRDPVYRGSAPP